MKHAIVTSFSAHGYELYGRRFIESYYDVGNTTDLWVYYEGRRPDSPYPTYRDLNEAEPRWFFDVYGGNAIARGITEIRDKKAVANYRFQAVKFAHKVFAVTGERPRVNWWLWIDADVTWEAKLDEAFFERACPDNALISYLDRKGWDHPECGFVGYRVAHPTAMCFLDDFRELYETGKIFRLREWHDSYVFQHLLERYGAWKSHFHNLAEGIADTHPWPRTFLGDYMSHHKGPEAKEVEYGRAV